MNQAGRSYPSRPAWVEIDLSRLRRNFQLICQSKPPAVAFISVLKDDAYGHGAAVVAREALSAGASMLALSTVEEAMTLRDAGITAPILLLGQRQPEELETCAREKLICCLNDAETASSLNQVAGQLDVVCPVHLKIDTGMSRYGVGWAESTTVARKISALPHLRLQGLMTHLAMSDERDKTFANVQIGRFNNVLREFQSEGIRVSIRHVCNSGGFLDLPHAHFDCVRLGLLPLGVYPSQVCARIEGLKPVMAVRTRIAQLRALKPGDTVGYGMRYTATEFRSIAVLPIGYGDGFPRVRNDGYVLIHGRRAPIIGGVAMDAMTVDVTEIPETHRWDVVTIMGETGEDQIGVHEIARLKGSVSYDVLTSWRARLPRLLLDSRLTPEPGRTYQQASKGASADSKFPDHAHSK